MQHEGNSLEGAWGVLEGDLFASLRASAGEVGVFGKALKE